MELDIREADRVRAHTAPPVRARIDRRTEASIARHGRQPRPEIARRIAELDSE